MIKKTLGEVTRMRRKIADLDAEIAKARKNNLTEQVKILAQERNALQRSVKDYEDRDDPQSKRRE